MELPAEGKKRLFNPDFQDVPRLTKKNWDIWWAIITKKAILDAELYTLVTDGVEPVFVPQPLDIPELDAAGQPVMRGGDIVMMANPYYRGQEDERRRRYAFEEARMWKKEITFMETTRRQFISGILCSLSKEIDDSLSGIPEYHVRIRTYDIAWIIEKIQFIATGSGGMSIAADALNLSRQKITEFSLEGLTDYGRRRREAKARLYSRSDDTAVLLHAMEFSQFITEMMSFEPLAHKAKETLTLPAEQQREEPLLAGFVDYMTSLTAIQQSNADSYGQVKGHMTDIELSNAKSKLIGHMAAAEEWQGKLEVHHAAVKEGDELIAMMSKGHGKYTKKGGGRVDKKGKSDGRETHSKLCFNCAEEGHLYATCPLLKSGKPTKCSTCGKPHHTDVHSIVAEVEEKLKRKGKAPWSRGGTVAHASDIHDAAEGMDGKERIIAAFKSMCAARVAQNSSDSDDEDLDDEFDLEDVVGFYSK